ncbi:MULTISPECIES: 1-deoxy-D-xylulose-5-phosphate reductoisomerase [Pacificimonas]|uniref:1-deoxy-D-xylulose 5-phosphate reductoisomerase n=1 Tax=Pacificimonas aurantium TaxID=1250540 RepID=A0ABS7WJM1_9SPHN|nr:MULTISPECIES: 1-deoxy-D-xylulose-5-phosphate reductoisomerase [Pacificimonas]MBZ6378597.1 1-deoxy-D-xylulose-5-phosphate reductoisomerase [Pacificimonas aurantium]
MTRSLSIFGATGSVGTSALELVAHQPELWAVEVLTANRNVDALASAAISVGASLAVIAEEHRYGELKAALAGTGIGVAAGADALVDAADREVDVTLAAIVGAAGLFPTLRAVERGGIVAVANKETLVCAGPVILAAAKASGATLLPVDSEHNAIFQVFDFEQADSVERIILTASGGPFRQKSLEEMRTMTAREAVAHPVWSMGAKISVDSATLMNKGLEMIEAERLFPVGPEKIDVVVHPQSIVHSFVEYRDGSLLAQLGSPDMKTPIAYALAYPERIETPARRLDLAEVARLDFEEADPVRFPALRLAREAMEAGGSAPIILNAANEEAVDFFLNDRIGFLEIAETAERALDAEPWCAVDTLDAIVACDARARRRSRNLMSEMIDA